MLWGFRTMESNHNDYKSRRLPGLAGSQENTKLCTTDSNWQGGSWEIEMRGKMNFIENELYWFQAEIKGNQISNPARSPTPIREQNSKYPDQSSRFIRRLLERVHLFEHGDHNNTSTLAKNHLTIVLSEFRMTWNYYYWLGIIMWYLSLYATTPTPLGSRAERDATEI